MLESFTVETFGDRVGERFRMRVDDATEVEVELTEVSRLREGAEGRRASFSIVLRGPAEPVLPQGTYRLEHDELGEFDLFLVPVGPDDEGMRYEAVFT